LSDLHQTTISADSGGWQDVLFHRSISAYGSVYQERANRVEAPSDQVLDAAWLRQLCLDAGADDVRFVERDRPEIADQKADIDNVFPRTRTLITVVCRMNRDNIRTPARSISNLEFHHTTDETNKVGLRIVSALEEVGM
jgi:hypothetical protein